MEAKMLLENLVIKYKTDETDKLYSHYCNFMIRLHTKQKYRGKNDPLLKLMTPSKINIVH
jgi:hypothetical protein